MFFFGTIFFSIYQKIVFFVGFPSVNSTNFDFLQELFSQIVDITKLKRKTLFKSLKNQPFFFKKNDILPFVKHLCRYQCWLSTLMDLVTRA
jgi:hypothetical protein